MEYLKGVDLNHWKTVTDWTRVKNSGIVFVSLKATQGISYIDPTFYAYVKGAKSVGLPVQAYHFAEPDKDATAQAAHFKQVIEGLDLEVIPCLDLETVAAGVDLNEWKEDFKAAFGSELILYTGDSFIHENGLRNNNDKLWVARYNTTGPTFYKSGGWNDWVGWQYTETGTLQGVQGSNNIDFDYIKNLDDILVKKEVEKVEKTPYDENQFKYLVGLAKQGNEWAKNELVKMMCYVTGGSGLTYDGKTTETVTIYNKVFAPVADILKLLGVEYTWDDTTKTVIVDKKCHCD